LPNYENSKLKRKERKSRSAHDLSDTNTPSLKVVAMVSVLLGNLHELSYERLDIRSLLIDETESS
jgi:hypothetical protein